jgi:hypothetical protein
MYSPAKSLQQLWYDCINHDPLTYATEAINQGKKKKEQKLPKDWEKKARKVIPLTLKELGYDQRNIDLVVEKLNPVDASEADKWLKSHRIIDKIPNLDPLFEKYPEVLAEHMMKYFTLSERRAMSTVSKNFNKIATSPLAWKNVVLLSDWSTMTDKGFTKIMKKYGAFIERLSVQKFCYLTSDAAKLIGDCCPNLKILFAGDCPSITRTVLKHIFKRCLKLEVIDLRFQTPRTRFAVERVPSVKKLPHLRELNLSNKVFAENSEISSQSLKILNIKESFTEGGYSSLKIDCPNLTHLYTSEIHQVASSLKKTVSVNQPRHGIIIHLYEGAGNGEFFTPKIMTSDAVNASYYSATVVDGTTLWIS